MSKLLVVFGATGQQGGSIISFVNKKMSDQFKIRAVTRDASKPVSKKLEKLCVEIVEADLKKKETVRQAVKGADAVFAMSSMIFDPLAQDELEQGRAIVDATVEEKVPYIIWSTLPDSTKISNGEFAHIKHFDQKAEIEQYIRGLPIKSSFFSPGCFMQNFHNISPPQPVGDGTYALYNVLMPSTKIPFIDIVEDSGKFVGALLGNPEKYQGKVIYAASGFYTYDEVAQAISKASGKQVKYKQVLGEEFGKFFPPFIRAEVTEMFQYFDKYGYFGPQTKEKVETSIPEVPEKLTNLEEFLVRNPHRLE